MSKQTFAIGYTIKHAVSTTAEIKGFQVRESVPPT